MRDRVGTEAVGSAGVGCISDGGWVLGVPRPPDSALIQTHNICRDTHISRDTHSTLVETHIAHL